MAKTLTREEYIEYLCHERRITREQLFADLAKNGRQIMTCRDNPCDYSECHGWICGWPEDEHEQQSQD